MSSVEIVVPCYNYAHFLRECVDSIATQSGVSVRVLIIDDASEDNTPEVASELCRTYPEVSYIRHDRNRGNIATYNHGLSLLTGDYLAIVSADDLLMPGALARAVGALDRFPSAAFVYGPVAHSSTPAEVSASHGNDVPSSTQLINGEEWSDRVCRIAYNPTVSPEVVVRRTAQREAGDYRHDLPYSADLEMWLRLSALGDVARIHGSLQAVHRLHDSNMSGDFIGVRELLERERAFEFFSEYSSRVRPDRASQFARTRNALAREALKEAAKQSVIQRQGKARREAHELIEFALERDSALRQSPLYLFARASMRSESFARVLGGSLRLRRVWRKRGSTQRGRHDGLGAPLS